MELALLAALACGALLAIQSRVNGELGTHVGAMQAAWISFGSGLVALSLLWLTPRFRAASARVREALRQGRLRPWHLLGGVAGGLLVGTQTYAVPLVGVATFLIAIVGGQMVSALVVDRLGVGPAAPERVTFGRVAASVLAVLGVLTAVGPELTSGLAWLPVLLAFLVGMGTSVQQATNALITATGGDAAVTGFVNFAVGTVVLVLVGCWTVLPAGMPDVSTAPWWSWSGGLIGVVFILGAAWAVMHSGVLLFGLVTVTSQLGTGVVLDLIEPSTRDQVGTQMLLGVALTVIAAVVAAMARARARRGGGAARPLGAAP
ncbi:DMT family transporter [Ornithinimicrobium sp. F0845]|uniref:DMT family transporter n=1 Tax=Ornithinimicrobium sp. F0845 TaxID=2926412 RepID=UPI001FF6567F|nr:DMT family transporter [Ornithinimicrobium sp. F0845]MCK0113297.1 DMT family transporter [Ornithinimicrobium sp. F0845]